MENTAIEWADHTHNHWVGCQKISPACDHCYAESWAKRTGSPELWAGNTRLTQQANRNKPLKWEALARLNGIRPRVFSSSLSDWLDNRVPPEWRVDLCNTVDRTPHLDWLLLSKRIGNFRQLVPAHWWPLPPKNVWAGATIANQEEAERDIPKLLAVPARIRFLSMEPLLGPVDLEGLLNNGEARLHWIIVGGESGGNARPLDVAWVRSLRDQCADAGVPFFFKQWGEYLSFDADSPCLRFDGLETFARVDGVEYRGSKVQRVGENYMVRVGKKAAGRMLDGTIYGELPA